MRFALAALTLAAACSGSNGRWRCLRFSFRAPAPRTTCHAKDRTGMAVPSLSRALALATYAGFAPICYTGRFERAQEP